MTEQKEIFTVSQDTFGLQKKYESMSIEEMSQYLAESNKQMSKMLNATVTNTSSYSELTTSAENEANGQQSDPHKKWTALFVRSASNGDVEKMKEILADESIRPLVDINAPDNDGTPPLIYAACFGKVEVAQVLIEAGANINAQDSFGWSALMWATNNSHESLVKILLDHGASAQTRSAKGRTVFDFVNTENQKMVDILATNPRDSVSSTSSILYKTSSSISSFSSAGDHDFYYHSTPDGYDQFMSEEAELRKKLFESTMALTLNTIDSNETQTDEDDDHAQGGSVRDQEDEDTESLFEENVFHWDRCSPDQMFVFNSDNLDHILDTAITQIQLPLTDQNDIHVPSNIIFLCARFAHYFSTPDLLEQVLEGALSRISSIVKKDTGLIAATAEQQLNLSESISEVYNLMIQDTEKRLGKLLPALLDHEEIPGINQVDFADDWHRFFRKNARQSMMVSLDSTVTPPTSAISPQSITGLLSSILFVFHSYDVHPIIVVQSLAQFFHYLSCEIFNRILTNKKLLCRSRAMQVRMNFSHLEDWVSINRLPNSLLAYLNPTIQLLQLLQCVTHLRELMDFINTTREFDTLNAIQIKRCVLSYRYEVDEDHIPEEIEKYAMQCAEDTVRHKLRKARQSIIMTPSRSDSIPTAAKRQSMSQFLGLYRNASSTSVLEQSLEEQKHSLDDTIYEEDEDDSNSDINETRDSKFLLPFSIPTSAHMNNSFHEENHIIPIIPEEWMEKLDKQ
ncbi:Dilute domain-containing protein C25B8.08 [Choanephora cucurbitarum]|uniref:Dilute domain-containing protein C25B8.08 n=1 Tax=Choanephora cucurbitarum TaxID=101091 RepID=A0A1C7NDC9_9FUNG|nr:Dilute domain-containing protein C25B8.08 [Choanephora cucurbitarum]